MARATDLLSRRKYQTLERLLKDDFVLVHVSTAAENVLVPEHLKKDPTVTLKLSRLFRGRLEMTESLITAELLFGNDYFTCEIPIASIWGMTGCRGKNEIWPESAPESILKEILTASLKEEGAVSEKKIPASKKPKKRHLKLVK